MFVEFELGVMQESFVNVPLSSFVYSLCVIKNYGGSKKIHGGSTEKWMGTLFWEWYSVITLIPIIHYHPSVGILCYVRDNGCISWSFYTHWTDWWKRGRRNGHPGRSIIFTTIWPDIQNTKVIVELKPGEILSINADMCLRWRGRGERRRVLT